MAALTIRNVDEAIKTALRVQAGRRARISSCQPGTGRAICPIGIDVFGYIE